ncbi:hypothetical protein AYI68_g392 [Smittium mucronatum]|uniref:Uncharacterized protein n=1 Tax=Smittium mucronatum TaxID=133383 RepID=A0A1R0H8D4_9FUNG|nr:hypothetical protein AYI68_g392 [Smittium mucronatum]
MKINRKEVEELPWLKYDNKVKKWVIRTRRVLKEYTQTHFFCSNKEKGPSNEHSEGCFIAGLQLDDKNLVLNIYEKAQKDHGKFKKS